MIKPMKNPTAGELRNKIKLLVLAVEALKSNELCQGAWPTPVDPENPALKLSSYSRYYADFDEDVNLYSFENGTIELEFEDGGAPDNDKCDEDVYVTREEYEEFLKNWPEFKAKREAAAKVNIGKIADLNKQVADLIDQMTELADEAGIDLVIDLGKHGSLDPESDWDSSRC